MVFLALMFSPAPFAMGLNQVGYPSTAKPSVNVDRDNGAADGVGGSVTITAIDKGIETANTNAAEKNDSSTATNDAGSNNKLDPMAGLGQTQHGNYCGWTDLATSLPANNPAWKGHSPSEGSLQWKSCAILLPGTPGSPGNFEGRPVEYRFAPNGTPAAPAVPVDPAALAQRAVRELAVPAPLLSVGPDRAKLAVNLWTWLWVDDPGQLSVTVAAGGVSVTAKATLTSVTWSLGEPATDTDTFQPGSPVTVTCQGAGTTPSANYDWKAEPPCGHKFRWRSLKERTSGTGTWPITATTNWTVTWASNTGVTGGTTLNATSNDQFDVGEYRTVLVQGSGG